MFKRAIADAIALYLLLYMKRIGKNYDESRSNDASYEFIQKV